MAAPWHRAPRIARARISALQCASSVVDRGTDAHICRTATEIAVQREIDVVVGWFADLLEQRDRAHHLARLAVAALRDIARDPGALHAAASWPVTPSIVVTSPSPSAEIGSEQARNGLPSINTVQAPQSAIPQPNFVPVSPRLSRSTQSSGVSPSTQCSGMHR